MHQMRQDGRLVAGTGADLQHPRLRRQRQQLGHPRHHIRLGDGLPLANRQRGVFPRFMFKGFINKLFARTSAIASRTRSSTMPCVRS